MGIFSRISTIVNANMSAMLDSVEEPEKIVAYMIRDMEATLAEVRGAASEVVANRMSLARAKELEQKLASDWEKRAQLALEKDREDLAREAMTQRVECDKRLAALEKQFAEAEALSAQYQGDIGRLQEKLQQARARQQTMVAQFKSAQNRLRVEAKLHQINTSSAFARFENYEARVDRYTAEAEVLGLSNSNFEKEFTDLEHGKEVNQELANLKARLNLASAS